MEQAKKQIMQVQNNNSVKDQDGNSSKPLLVAGLLCFSSVSNIFCPAELVDKQHFRNYNKHSSRLVLVLELVYIFHIRKNIDKRLSALFLLSCVRSWDKLLLIVI